MNIGLVHGRFQPFHNGHKFLIDEMLKECDVGVVLIGSATKHDERNPFSLESRKEMIRSVYGEHEKLFIGANVDVDSPYAEDAQWDVVFSSCVLSLTGHLPTHVYGGGEYGVSWKRVRPEIRTFTRYEEISATDIRKLMQEKNFGALKILVPKTVFDLLEN